ncbi:2-phospho-L-lactate guanylyltransferase [Microbacterium saperdae]|uniref:2-phospho-L-lactate guanylyltransferase n=1 Tax=Microbacterium saperdae TaxID=69368 RepID=A0A543BL98_9MICO|nr:2-phospho-L-lactate guanylyltransferase [Microbacterium saperdae]TQL85591.1 2-phospho-L-lactate guanylyltransferase [Microbacterium saperdae]GGM62437.1 hypothetical protein GCM10010489_37470 [Microbacterium saperdae]
MSVVAPAWTIIIPLKDFRVAKSRLLGVGRPRLARAMAADTLRAVAACRSVEEIVVVASNVESVSPLLPRKARVVAEGAPGGVNKAIAIGRSSTSRRRRRAALVGDLPFLTPEDLAEALVQAAECRAGVVPDKEGTGTTMVTWNAEVEIMTHFGRGSFHRHTDAGYAPLLLRNTSGVRWDVDVREDLAPALPAEGTETLRVIASLARRVDVKEWR